MNIRVLALTTCTFVAGMVELVIGGILPVIAEDLQISISAAGQLITVFAFVFAFSGPVLLALTAKLERKRLFLWTLALFCIGNLLAFFSPNYVVLMTSRVCTAMGAALITVLSLTIATKIVDRAYLARALGLVFMGVSSSVVLGVPIGVMLTEAFNWRAPFLLIAGLTIVSMLIIQRFLKPIEPESVLPLAKQLLALRTAKLISAHLVTFLMLAGHFVLYAYFTFFLQEMLQLDSLWISIVYFVYGAAAVAGGGIGGWMTDRFGLSKTIVLIITSLGIVMLSLPWSIHSAFFFALAVMAWGMFSWALSPAQQSYLVQTAPASAGIQQSFNTTALHLGIAFGSAVGGVVVGYFPIQYNAWFGALFILGALGSALFSLSRPKPVELAEAKA